MSWIVLLLIAAGAYGAKAAGALAGARVHGQGRLQQLLMLLPPALLTALIAVWTLDGGSRLVLDARAGGVVVGGLAAWFRAPFLVVAAVAAATTALLRLL